jgi:hypothetical protein
MIRQTDALRLARTKLKTHRIRTAITIIIAALLFGVLFFISFVSTGAFQSLASYSKQGLTSRYIASGSPGNDTNFFQNQKVMDIATRLYNEELVARKAEAKRLGLDESTAVTGVQNPVNGSEQGGFTYLDMSNPISAKAIKEYLATQQQYTTEDFLTLAKSYHPKATYTLTGLTANDGDVTEMKGGKEIFDDPNKSSPSYDYKKTPIFSEPLATMPTTLLESYLLKDPKWSPTSGTIPLLIPQFRAEQLLDMKAPADSASSQEKLNYSQTLREKITGKIIAACYRNVMSSQQIKQAVSVAAEIEQHKNDKTYQRPSLQYGLPSDDSCGQATVLRDVRTAAEKKEQQKLDEFNAKFNNTDQTPRQEKLQFQVVGVLPDSVMAMGGAGSVDVRGLLSMMLMINLPGLSIPQSYLDQMPKDSAFFRAYSDQPRNVMYSLYNKTALVEFSSDEQLKTFIDKENCKQTDSGSCDPKASPYKPFIIQSYGSNSAAIADAQKGFMNIFSIAMLVIIVIAIIILSFSISRAVADGRRETAVFRAIGFKRFDISLVYLTYTQLLALRIILVALLLGAVGALIVHSMYWVDLTVEARLAFGAKDAAQQFTLFGFDWKYLVLTVAAVLVATLLASIIPLVRNARRNPIRDMRDE